LKNAQDIQFLPSLISSQTKAVKISKTLYGDLKDALSEEINSILPEIYVKS